MIGKRYTTDLGRQMPYGAIIGMDGIIKRVMTKDDYPDLFEKKCEIAEAKRDFAEKRHKKD